LTQPVEIYFDPKGKIENFEIFRGKFSKPKPKMADPTWPNLSNKKIFDPDPSLVHNMGSKFRF